MSTTDVRALRSARDDFLSSGRIAERFRTVVRPEIAASWSRSQRAGVSPLEAHLPNLPEHEVRAPLDALAKPILAKMADELEGLGCALSLADGQGRLVRSWIPDTMVRGSLRRIMADPGASCSEKHVGTNGIGTALADLQPKIIGGAEHWGELHLDMTCVAAPVLDPVSRRPAAVINVTMMEQTVHPALTALVRWSVAELREAMLERSGAAERRLFEQFLAHRGRSDRPSMVLSRRIVVADPAAAQLFPELDAADLWEQVGGAGASRSVDLELPDGVVLPVRVSPLAEDGVLVEVCRGTRAPLRRSAAGRPASPVYVAATAQAGEAVAAGVPVLLVGEPGTGKATLAAELLKPWGEGTLAVSHLDALTPDKTEVIRRAVDDGLRVVATTRNVGLVAPELLELFDLATVTVPPLRERLAELPALVAELTARLGRPARWSGEALDALARRRWAGNLRELESVVTRTLINSSGLIRVADLPLDVRQEAGRKRLTRMEQAERDAIVAALAASAGNKAIAAEELGISRSSLYRKIDRYGLADSGQVEMRMRS
ncbi:helix-turn-helix domain-containing protein [Pseudonocardia yuanmonensis]|uniref:Helix-turn-helix domain-containing protein n=1 Tax=Pseudonocardia yuanmonensis TaxID=1095914 RepID=A0ABP8WK98_9PSEU